MWWITKLVDEDKLEKLRERIESQMNPASKAKDEEDPIPLAIRKTRCNMNIRELAITLLDDWHGISEDAWLLLSDALKDSGDDDVRDKVETAEGRFYLAKDDAKLLRVLDWRNNR